MFIATYLQKEHRLSEMACDFREAKRILSRPSAITISSLRDDQPQKRLQKLAMGKTDLSGRHPWISIEKLTATKRSEPTCKSPAKLSGPDGCCSLQSDS